MGVEPFGSFTGELQSKRYTRELLMRLRRTQVDEKEDVFLRADALGTPASRRQLTKSRRDAGVPREKQP
jgi:hypothetical protein